MKRNKLTTCNNCSEAKVLDGHYLCLKDGNVRKGHIKCKHGVLKKPMTCMMCQYWMQDEKHASQYGACAIKGKQFAAAHECWDGDK